MSTPAVHRGTVSLRRAVTSWALRACLMSGAAGISLIATTGSTALATRVSQSPRGAANVSGAFNAVTLVPGSKDVIAVGSWYGVSSSGDVIEEWNGSSWKNMKVPSFGAGITSEALSGVWAASASDVWAVGYEVDASGQTAQLLHWNGKSWKADTLTGLPANSVLSAISGVSSSDIWSVGYGSGRVSTAIEVHYNGTSWAVSTQGPSNAILSGVAAVSASSVWAIGSAGATPKPLVLHYDGSSWKSSSSPAASDVYFNAVSASGSTAWVVGSVDTSKPAAYSMEWTGSKWVSIKMAVPSGQAPRPTAVLTLSSSTAWAGGEVNNKTNTNWSAYAEEFTKGKWSNETLPAAGNGSSIAALAASSAGNIWAAGSYFTGKICVSPDHPLSYHHTSSWKVVPTATPTGAIAHC